MSMPSDLVFIRHGQSEANVMQGASKNGDETLFTDETMTVPDNSWRLTAKGVEQARTAGDHLRERYGEFDRHIVSPFMRTRETAYNLQLESAQWKENRIVRERSWGEIDSMSKQQFKREYPNNWQLKEKDPIYWAPPAGESLAKVAEDRSSNFLRSLSQDSSDRKVLVVSHGEFITSTRMIIERWSDEDFYENDADPDFKINNCAMVQYTRRDPKTGNYTEKLQWVRTSHPAFVDGEWTIIMSDWRKFGRKLINNKGLKTLVDRQERRLKEEDAID